MTVGDIPYHPVMQNQYTLSAKWSHSNILLGSNSEIEFEQGLFIFCKCT